MFFHVRIPFYVYTFMLRYFRINDPYRLLGLLVLLVLLYVPLFVSPSPATHPELTGILTGEKVAEGFRMYSAIIDDTPPLAAWWYGACDLLTGRHMIGRHILGVFILFLQSAFLGFLFISKRALPENTFIPSFLFSLLVFLLPDGPTLHADLLAFGCLLMVMLKLFNEIEFREQRDENIFSLGVMLAAASLLNFSYLVYLPGSVVLLLVFTRTSGRRYLLMLTGFVLPHALLLLRYYYTQQLPDLLNRFYMSNVLDFSTAWVSWKSLTLLCLVPVFYAVVSLVILNREARLTKYQSQLLQVMFLLFAIGCLQVAVSRDLRPQSLLPLLPSVSFFLTHFFLLIRRRKFAEWNTWLLLTGMTATAYLNHYKGIQPGFDRLYVNPVATTLTGTSVLDLTGTTGSYQNNTLSPPLVNARLTQELLAHHDRYPEVLLVNNLFEQDPPAYIIDPELRLVPFFERLPALKKKYQKSSVATWERVP